MSGKWVSLMKMSDTDLRKEIAYLWSENRILHIRDEANEAIIQVLREQLSENRVMVRENRAEEPEPTILCTHMVSILSLFNLKDVIHVQ